MRWLEGTYGSTGQKRISHERIAVDALIESVGETAAQVHRGYTPDNRLPVPGWESTPLQQLQFGDLRYEQPVTSA